MDTLSYFLLIAFVNLLIVSQKGCLGKISCFTCSSRNHSNPDCEDPFQPRPSSYVERCKAPKRGHQGGEFPAHYCIKLTGTSSSTNEKLVIRRCVVQNMENQCGQFKLENDTLHGCILTCVIDGCNHATSLKPFKFMVLPELIIPLLMAVFTFSFAS